MLRDVPTMSVTVKNKEMKQEKPRDLKTPLSASGPFAKRSLHPHLTDSDLPGFIRNAQKQGRIDTAAKKKRQTKKARDMYNWGAEQVRKEDSVRATRGLWDTRP